MTYIHLIIRLPFLDNSLSQVRFTILQTHTRHPVLTLENFRLFSKSNNEEMSHLNPESVGIYIVFSLLLKRGPIQLEDS